MLIKMFGDAEVLKTSLLLIIACTAVAYGELCGFYSSTPTCKKLQEIKQSMDETVNPCEDFFGYACNNWGQHLATPYYDSTMAQLDYQIHYNLISVMDTLEQESLPLRILNETYSYYKSCLSAKGTNSLMGFLEIIKPGEELEWPLLQELKAFSRGDSSFSADNWPAERFDAFALLGQLRTYGLNNLMFNLDFSRNSSDTVLAEFSPKSFQFSAYHFLSNAKVFSKLLSELGFSLDIITNYTQVLQKTHSDWNQDLPGQKNSSTFITNYGEIKIKFPYIAKIMENIQIHRFADGDMIRLTSLEYFEFLQKKPWTPTEKRNMCNYIMIRFLYHLYEYTAKSFTKNQCIQEVRVKMDLPINILYYAYIYRPDELHTNAEIEVLFRKTRDYIVQELEKLPEAQSYDMADIKMQLNKISLNLGNLPRNMSVLYFNKLYGDLPKLSANDFYSNKLNLLKHLSRLPLIVESNTTYYHYYGEPELYRSLQRPFYHSITRMLILPFVNLQPPCYHYTFDPIFKWSTLPYFLAHGLYESLPFLDKYNITTYNFHRTSIVELLYRAYANEQKHRLQPDFTNISWKQLFFLSLAQSFCTTDKAFERLEFALFLRTFPSEIEGFVEAFQCDRSKMKENRTNT